MSLRYLLDTDTFSHMVKGLSPEINARLGTLTAGEAALSVITTGEFYYGTSHAPISKLRQQRAQRLIDFFGVLPVDDKVGQCYGRIRAQLRADGTHIGPNNLWLAAHAQALGVALVSGNRREFQRVAHLNVEDWMEPS